MKKKKIGLFFVMIYMICLGSLRYSQEKPTAGDILDKIDQNMVFNTAYAEVDMIITIKNRVITKNLVSYSRGNEKSYIEFLSPPRDKSTKMLKINDIVKVYYPSAERVMRLSGHMLRQGMMGSDFSYEDMTERAKKLQEEYTAEIKGEEEVNGNPCYLMVLTSKIPKQTYFTRKIWVDNQCFLVLKEELYAKSGKLLKTLTAGCIKSLKNRFYPTRIIMEDKLRNNSKTEMNIKKIEFDIPLPQEIFSERQLMKK